MQEIEALAAGMKAYSTWSTGCFRNVGKLLAVKVIYQKIVSML
jgi:hypothetical protein